MIGALLTLSDVLRHHESNAGFHRIAIEPFLSADDPAAAALIARRGCAETGRDPRGARRAPRAT